MRNKIRIAYNPCFHLPLLAWMVIGGILLLTFNKEVLFASINTHYSVPADYVMYYITWMGQPEVIIPTLIFLLLLIPSIRSGWFFLSAIVCNITPLGIQQLLKRYFHHPRPLNYFHWTEHKAAWIHYLPQWPELLRNSFPSGHSQGAFSFFCFLSLLLPARYRWWGTVFFLCALMVCYSRMYLAAHFFADVYTGSLIGGITTTLLFSVMEMFKPVKKIKKIIV